MRKSLTLLFLLFIVQANAQRVLPMVDFNNFFKSFENGQFKALDLQPIKEYKAGDDVVGYVDIRGNLRVYDGIDIQEIANVPTIYTVSDHLLTWKIAETLNLWDQGELKTLSFRCGSYTVKDSLVVFQDTRFNTLNVYYNGDVTVLTTSIEGPKFADFIGENIVAYRDNGDVYKVFWRGKIYELDAWQGQIKFEAGTDMLAFNDPITGTFAIFENGQFLDLEEFHMNTFKVGRGFVVYENQNNDLRFYKDGTVKTISNFGASSWRVVDDVVFWKENGVSYGYQNGQKYELGRFNIEEIQLKNNVIAYRNVMGGVDALMEGKIINITNQSDSKFSIHGDKVLVELFNSSYIVQTAEKSYTL